MRNLLRLARLFARDLPALLFGTLVALVSLALGMSVFAAIGLLIGAQASAGLLRLLAAGRVLLRYAERLATHDATFRILARLRLWLFNRLVPLAPVQLGFARSGDLLSRLTADIDALDGFYLRLLLPGLLIVLFGGMGLYAIACVAPHIALVLLGALLATALLLLIISYKAAPHQQAVLDRQGELRTHVIDGVEGLSTLLACGAAHQQAAVLARATSSLVREQLAVSRAQSRANALGIILHGGILLTLIVLAPTVVDAPGTLLLWLLAYLGGAELVASLPGLFMSAPRLAAASGRIFALADTQAAVREPEAPLPLPEQSDIVLEHVSLSYGREVLALDDINLTIQTGARVALMGGSGAGKTSLAALLLKFIAPTTGQLRIGGAELASLNGDAWRSRIGYLSQHTDLLAGTIADNLRLAKPEASAEMFRAALKAVELDNWLASLPEGLETWIGEDGLQLSGGQARRLALAMVVLRDAPLWLLDEPTEGLDEATTQAMLATINRLTQGRTVLLITHNATTLAPLGLQRLILLENGKIASDGPI